MSTGDQTAYIRSKVAERGHAKTPNFMRDGFDAWAESSAPAREGGMEKEPAEQTGLGRHSIHQKYVVGGQMHGGMNGGISPQDFLGLVPQLFDWFNQVKSFTTTVKEDLRDPAMPAKYQKTAKSIANALELIGLGKPPHEALYESCMEHMGPSMRGGMRGGSWQTWFDKVGKNLKSAYDWFLLNKPAIHFILKMRSINPGPGPDGKPRDYPAQLERAMTSVGLGRYGGIAPPFTNEAAASVERFNKEQAARAAEFKAKLDADVKSSVNTVNAKVASEIEKARNTAEMIGGTCGCAGGRAGGRRVGGRAGGAMTPAQMEAAARRAMAEVKTKARAAEGTVSPYVANIVKKAKEKAVKVGGRAGGGINWGDVGQHMKSSLGFGRRGGDFLSDFGNAFGIPSGKSIREEPKVEYAMMQEEAPKRQIRGAKEIPSQIRGAKEIPSQSMNEAVVSQKGRGSGINWGDVGQHMKSSLGFGGRAGGAKKSSARGEIVKKVMREKNMSLPEASKYVKQNNLY